MTEAQRKEVTDIIESYCEGISFLEFSADKLPEMVGKIGNVFAISTNPPPSTH